MYSTKKEKQHWCKSEKALQAQFTILYIWLLFLLGN